MAEEFKIRNVLIADMEAVFDLSNDKDVRKNSINQEKISWEAHQSWFKSKINETEPFFVIFDKNKFVGYVRFGGGEENPVTMHLAKNYRGRGFGVKILKRVLAENDFDHVTAFVRMENTASIKMFERADFLLEKCAQINNENYQKLVWENHV